ncbi:MAG TPA: biosynthetic-type acetolactate synthase large subunit [Candidatus Acidoferrales bacterium]|jgi:acetolactate synthase-1/2/3 large subunit|nr:biosynthetic-type acetolactate synthase large subunit [Candidatus Acidoferrales bacterium]
MKLTGAEILCETLTRLGVKHIFGYPGGAILPVYDALGKSKLHHILVRHEQGATHMADGYARATGGVGVAMATSGPGATNMVTGIATAMLDSSPVVCITGQVSSKLLGSDAFQEVDITGITMPITKHNVVISKVEDIARTVREAFIIANSGRPGPVLVDITKDAQQATAEFDWEASAPKLPVKRQRKNHDQEEFDRAVELLNSAKRPLILAGRGIMLSGAMRTFEQFVHTSNIPVAMTLLGIGCFPASDPLNLGMMGMHGEAWVNNAIQEADLLIAVGMRFDDRVTGDLRTYARNAKKIHIEVDRAEINKNVKVDAAIIGDAGETLAALLPHIHERDHSGWMAHITSLKGDSAVRDIQSLPDSGHLYAAHVINDLWKVTQGNAIVVTDVGQHQMWEAQYYHHNAPRTLITSGGLGTMGFALPAAIGAKMARPNAEVWVVVGDGGFQMTMCELATIAQEKINIKIAIINNGYLGMVRQWQEFFYDKRYVATPLVAPNFAALANSFGIRGETVTARKDVVPTIEAARKSEQTVLIDFRVEQEDSVYPMVAAGAALHDMIRRPNNPLVETATEP